MENILYETFFALQNKHWWFRTKKKIIIDLILRYFAKTRYFAKKERLSRMPLRILDIGCGSGLMLKSLRDFGDVYGMDASSSAIKFSKTLHNGTIKKGLLPWQIPFQEDFFDLIVALDVIEHVDEDQEALISINNLMKKEGLLILTVPALMSLWSKFDEINHHKRRYIKSDLIQKLDRANFKVLKISYYNFFLLPFIFIFRKIEIWIGREVTSDLNMPNKFVNYVFEKIFLSERFFLKYLNFPIGVSIIAVVEKK